jgi:hypothetical protein
MIDRLELLTESLKYFLYSDFMHIIYSMHTFCMVMQVPKNTFVIFYSGERAKAKILKICDAFNANRYPFPDDVGKQLHAVQEVSTCFTVFVDILGLFLLW